MGRKRKRSNDRPKGGRESWRVPTLVRRALTAKNEDLSWKCIVVLQRRGTLEVLAAATQLCHSDKAREREVGADILGQARAPDKDSSREALKVLHRMLRSELVPDVLDSVLVAIGHAQHAEDRRGLRRIAAFRRHPNKNVRFGVVMALSGREDSISVRTLIELTRDPAGLVRDWSTFGVGTLIDLDTPRIRRILRERLADTDNETRCEAIMGLAKRKDRSTKGALLLELASDRVTTLAFEAAAEYGDRDMILHLQRHLRVAQAEDRGDSYWLRVLKDAVKTLRRVAKKKQ